TRLSGEYSYVTMADEMISPAGRLTEGIFFFNTTALYANSVTPEMYTLSLHDALPISRTVDSSMAPSSRSSHSVRARSRTSGCRRSEEHTSELQSRGQLVCRLLLEKKKTNSPDLTALTFPLPGLQTSKNCHTPHHTAGI